jgi:hypothetical protein
VSLSVSSSQGGRVIVEVRAEGMVAAVVMMMLMRCYRKTRALVVVVVLAWQSPRHS